MASQAAVATDVPQSAAGPITARERIIEVDILRGFALLGILIVNILTYGNSFYEYILMSTSPGTLPDQVARWLIAFLGEGKFFSLFSLLFGFGLAIQMMRAEARGSRFVPVYLRRLFALLLFGLAHAIFFWVGDILVPYAILGLLLLLFRKARPKTLVIWAGVFLGLILIINLGLLGLVSLASLSPEGAEMMAQANAEQMAGFQAAADQANRAYATGSFMEVTRQRINDMGFIYPITLFIAPNIFAMFLLGLAAGKKGIFQDIAGNQRFFKRLQIWGLVIGVAGNLVYASLGTISNAATPTLASFLASAGQTIGAPALTAFYLSTLVLLAQNPAWRVRLMPLASVGRMALTNYLLQTIIATTLFYGYGLGLYGRIGEAGLLGIAIIIYLAQIPFSIWWMNRFLYGPFEWLWRALTYGYRPAMRREQPNQTVQIS